MNSCAVVSSMKIQGFVILFGSLVWPRPYFPTRVERARLVAHAIPRWATATDATAAWVWTGFGQPEPWRVLRQRHPAISPLERTHWQAVELNPEYHRTQRIAGLSILSPADTVREVLLGSGNIDVAGAQVMMLTGETSHEIEARISQRRTTEAQRNHARRVLHRVEFLRQRYPDITR
jgi:hypothetical protein